MAAAIQFSLHHPAVACVLMGPRDASQAMSNIEMFRVDIPNDLWAEMKHEGMLPADAPTPG
jgi:D-threo-aldose 1-dehydrogenase